jgi:hypothetical protein
MEDVNEELEDTSSHHSADDDQYQEEEEVQQQAQRTLSGSIFPTTQKKKARSMRRFGTRRPKSKKQKEEMVKLREISMHLGGGQYFKKRGSEIVTCEQCGKTVNSRLTEHAYSHLDGLDLFKVLVFF